MMQCVKYLSTLNLVNLANHVVANTLSNVGDSGSECNFYRLYKWRTFKKGFKEAKVAKKPICLFIHKFTCPACHTLKAKFVKSMRLMDLSDRFVMIHVEVGVKNRITLNDKKYQPDGKYVPRLLFFTPDGELIKEAYNKHPNVDKDTQYFYSSAPQIIETMLFVLKDYCKDPLPVTFDYEQWNLESGDTDDEILVPTMLD
ncbi:thioredoxin domain-containing protein 12 [Andrena cerasifolii]|uniref:thioredoxin domain-containing protein 12 n=1 Tax=Andrena cerasifolii TaxID=2819439 RepID=UPI00403807B0